MKKLLAFYLMASVITIPAFAAQDATESEQIKEIVTAEIMTPSLMDYSGEASVQKKDGEYTVTVPKGTLKDENRTFPAFSFPLKKAGDFNGKARYHVSLTNLSHVLPVLIPIFEQYNVTYGSVNYNSDLVPALNLIEKEDFTLDKLAVPFEQGANFTINKINVKTENTMNKSDIKGVQKAAFENIAVSHMFGTASIQNLDVNFSAPFVLRTTTAIDDLLNSSGFKEEMTIKNAQIKSLFAQASFNITQSLDVKQKEDKEIDAKLLINVKDLYVADQEDLPQNVSLDVDVAGFTYEELFAYEEALRMLNESSMLLSDGTAENEVAVAVEKNFEDAKNALLDKMVVNVNEVNLNSDKYTVVLNGVLIAKDEQFDGKLTVVNFDYLAPEEKSIDKAVCEDVMNRVMNGSLGVEAFEREFNDKCSEKKGPLSSLRPYAASAKHTKLNGQDALVFDVNVKGDNLLINGQPVDIEEF